MEDKVRNRCLSIRTTDELSKELERYEGFKLAKGTVAHLILAKVLSDLTPEEISRFVNRYPDRGCRLRLVRK